MVDEVKLSNEFRQLFDIEVSFELNVRYRYGLECRRSEEGFDQRCWVESRHSLDRRSSSKMLTRRVVECALYERPNVGPFSMF